MLIKQKIKIKKAFIKTRNPFLKSALNAIPKKIKKLIKSHWATDIHERIQSLWLTQKKEVHIQT